MDECVSKAETCRKEREKLLQEMESAKAQISKLHELERERDELTSKAAITAETLTVLKAELVQEKVSLVYKTIMLVPTEPFIRNEGVEDRK